VVAPVLLVVPTLGRRLDFLALTLESIRSQDVPVDIVVVTPADAVAARELATAHGATVVDDPGSLPSAINLGVAAAQPQHEYVNWIGDDDLLAPGSLAATTQALQADQRRVLAYGACSYIDDVGRPLWVSRAGRWAQTILPWGPDLIPQPGMLVRLDAWHAVGGVDASLKFAFDLDLLLKLRQRGTFVDVGRVVSSFRWHPDSLTVSDRTTSLDESEAVKRRYLSPGYRRVSWLWEQPVRVATRVAAREVTRRARRLSAPGS
jgi:GT2 family glycosyltransferase